MFLIVSSSNCMSFFFQTEDGIRDGHVTGVQTCALPILENEVLRYLNNLRIKPSLLKRKPIKTFIQGAPTVIFLVGLLIFVQIMSYIYGNGPTDISTVYRFGALQSGDTNPEELFRVITYIFVHIGGTFHLLSNISCLLILGHLFDRIFVLDRFMVVFLFIIISVSTS